MLILCGVQVASQVCIHLLPHGSGILQLFTGREVIVSTVPDLLPGTIQCPVNWMVG
jgi:hypothetical protein